MDGEVAAFVRVYMQAAEAQLLVTKHLLGNDDSRVQLDPNGSGVPTGSETSSTPGSAQATAQRRSLTFRDCGQPGGILESATEGLSRGGARDGRATAAIFAAVTGRAASESGQVTPEAGSR